MDTPPTYVPQPAKKSNVGLILAIVLGSFALCCILMIVFAGSGILQLWKNAKPMIECEIAFSDVRRGIHLYADAHDGKLPKAETWQDDVRPYLIKALQKTGEDRGPFKPMKVDGDWYCKSESSNTGIAFNSKLSGKKLSDITNKRSTVLIFEIEKPGKNAHEEYKERPDSTAPKIMGSHRSWIVKMVEGGRSSSGSSGFDIDTDEN